MHLQFLQKNGLNLQTQEQLKQIKYKKPIIDNLPALVIIETGASLINDRNANINKLVSIYPKYKVDNYLNKFKKK